ncbi:MAG: translation initiation factor IF-2 [Bacteroidota bacterium]|nr:translation initiation factor IF-2 [Bacteroidota bacterium]
MPRTSKKGFKKVALHRAARELNISSDAIVAFLEANGHDGVLRGKGINAKITDEDAYLDLLDHYASDLESRQRVVELRAARQQALEEEAAARSGDASPVEVPQMPQPEEEPQATQPELATETPEPTADAPELAAETPEPAAETPEPTAEMPETETPEPTAEDPAPTADEPTAVEPVGPEEVESVEVEVPDEIPAAAEEPEAVAEDEPEQAVRAAEEEPVDEMPAAAEESATAAETPVAEAPAGDEIISADRYKLQGTTILGTIDLKTVSDQGVKKRRKRKRKGKPKGTETAAQMAMATETGRKRSRKRRSKVDQDEVKQTVQETLRAIDQSSSRARQRRRRARRKERADVQQSELEALEGQDRHIQVTEFVSTGELADIMGVAVTDVITKLFEAGMMVSINQRLDADTISIVADEFDYSVDFITEFGTSDVEIEEDDPDSLEPRAPVITVMGHVDHGKTSLLDFIRNANVAIGESGGITQHIGAYRVKLENGRVVTFLDTPGHEAFTAMRARGAKVTDLVILVVAANDSVMPQTIEAINHSKAAEVPIIVAINKIDLPEVNIPRVMQELSDHGVLVESYGGSVQCSQVSAKTGQGIDDLLEKVLLEADLMELRANPERRAQGVVIESRLDRGRGNVATVLVQNGTLRIGDPFVAGVFGGRVRAMFDEWDQRISVANPSEPALVLGLPGQPTVGDQFVGVEDETEARTISQRRQQIWREQKMRQYKHVRLEDIGRRLALGDFSELNLIIKGDVGGSVEALTDALQKLSNEEVAVKIIHAGVGAITESDVMLASASDAVIIGFQVRPTAGARAASDREEIDIHTYSIIYDAIEDVRDALEGLLQPEETEKISGVAEIRQVFKVPKVGAVAGCYITEGRIKRSDTVHVLRESIIIYTGRLSSLRRFKDDVREVLTGYECGIGIENYNDIKVGDQIEAYQVVETKRTLAV